MYFDDDVDKSSPWITYKSKFAYKNRWLTLREDDVKAPNGQDSTYSYVDKIGAVGAVAMDPNNNIYLVGQYRYPMKEYTWEIVEGGSEVGESKLDAMKRELKEEAGIIGGKYDVVFDDLHISNSITNERGTLFLVRDFQIEQATPESTEKIVVKKLPFDEVINLIYQEKIKDAFSIIGILMAQKFLINESKKN